MNRFLVILLLVGTLLGFALSHPTFEGFGRVEREQIKALASKRKAIEKRGGGDCGFHDNCDRKRGRIDEEWPNYDLNSNIFFHV
ncbi:hypothetical protein QR680_013501 [Steinernema hermaphroditum]|uniref:Uncharacterized protein n=1 Tax=Steinernema hermaphroditum TaxID=289476 RepID=A0AA39I5Q6_9BILA|nr:hypothetical protein QR680_013501 [Steinernema hermaphroditum]